LHQGFGQSEVKSRQAVREQSAGNAARRALDASLSNQIAVEARARESEKLAHVISPVSVSYSIRDLQASARLMDGFKLDLTPNAGVSAAQFEAIAKRAVEIMRSGNGIARAPVVPRPPPPPSSTGATRGAAPSDRTVNQAQETAAVPVAEPMVVEPVAVERAEAPTDTAGPVANPTPAEAAAQQGLRRSPRRVTMSQEAIAKDVSDEWRRQRGQAYPVTRTYQLSFSQIAAKQVAAESMGRVLRFTKKKVIHRAGSVSNVRSKVNFAVAAAAVAAALLPATNAQTQSWEGAVSVGDHVDGMTAYFLVTVCIAGLVILNRVTHRQFADLRRGGAYNIGVAVMSLAAAVLFGNVQALSVSWGALQPLGLGGVISLAAVLVGMLAWRWVRVRCAGLHRFATRE